MQRYRTRDLSTLKSQSIWRTDLGSLGDASACAAPHRSSSRGSRESPEVSDYVPRAGDQHGCRDRQERLADQIVHQNPEIEPEDPEHRRHLGPYIDGRELEQYRFCPALPLWLRPTLARAWPIW